MGVLLDVLIVFAFVGFSAFVAHRFMEDIERELERQDPSRARAHELIGRRK